MVPWLCFQIITLSDLECDYINARACCSKLNKVGPYLTHCMFEPSLLLCQERITVLWMPNQWNHSKLKYFWGILRVSASVTPVNSLSECFIPADQIAPILLTISIQTLALANCTVAIWFEVSFSPVCLHFLSPHNAGKYICGDRRCIIPLHCVEGEITQSQVVIPLIQRHIYIPQRQIQFSINTALLLCN